MREYFRNMFKNLDLPIIVYRNETGYPLEYANPQAMLMIDPARVFDASNNVESVAESKFLRFKSQQTRDDVFSILQETGVISNYPVEFFSYEEKTLQGNLYGTRFDWDGENYLLIIMLERRGEPMDFELMMAVFQASYRLDDANSAIDRILGFVGEHVRVDRAYIFEDIGGGVTRNTYEWCGAGIEPMKQELQNVPKEGYNYDAIVNGGVYIVDDTREMPKEAGRDIVEMQGIKSLALLPLYHMNQSLGYVGFDAVREYRKWTPKELLMLKFTNGIIESLLVRRNETERLAHTHRALQTISDSNDSIIYVNDPDSYALVFANKATCDSLGISDVASVIGKECWQVMQKDGAGPCPFCPMDKMRDEQGHIKKESLNWEFKNTFTNKWYMAKDAFIKWIDGRTVHIETATEITKQKAYEEELRHYASTDHMTGAYNREWGLDIIASLRSQADLYDMQISLCFLDLDDLKGTNDRFGHEAGDYMIVETVNTLRRFIRKDDIICRWGGDEFLVLLKCAPEEARRIMEKIMDDMRKRNDSRENTYPLSFSFGITDLLMDIRDTADQIINRADALMYEQKMAKKRKRSE